MKVYVVSVYATDDSSYVNSVHVTKESAQRRVKEIEEALPLNWADYDEFETEGR